MRDYDFFKWRRDMLHHFQTITTSEQIYKLLQQQTELLEYDYFSLCVRHPVPFTRPKVSIHTSYPERWINQYMAENFQAIDPVLKVENFCRGHLPWDDTLFRDATTLWDAARDNGVCKGATQCLMLPNRAMGFFSVSREDTKTKNPCSDDEMELRLQTLVELSLLTLLRLDDDMVTPPEMRFSKRELEILKWTAEGKTSAEIAMILSISENTVNFHQKNMQKKFNAPNKTQIACYAAATGII